MEPRLGTLERILAACGRTLESQPRSGVDRAEIRELLVLPPLARLAWPGEVASGAGFARLFEVLRGQGVRFVVVGDAAERLRGSPMPVGDLVLKVPADEIRGTPLRRVLEATNRRFWRVTFTVLSCSRTELESLLRGATWIQLRSPKTFPVPAIEALISATSPDRAEALRAVREEADARPVGRG